MRDPTKDLYANQTIDEEFVQYGVKEQLPSSNDITPIDYHFTEALDLAAMVSFNTGVDLDYGAYEYNSWVNSVLSITWNFASYFIPPFIVPMASLTYNVAFKAMTDPESFAGDNVLKLSTDAVNETINSAQGMAQWLADEFKKARKGA